MKSFTDAAFIRLTILLFILCLSASSPLWAGSKAIRIAAAGDIMLGGLSSDEASEVFSEVKPYLKNCRVVIGNLEGPLTDRGTPSKTEEEGVFYVFRTPPQYAGLLSEAGFTVMSLANNHVYDYGEAGYKQTAEVLDQAGILKTGGPGQVARQKVGKTTVSVIGLAPNKGCQDINDIPAAEELVRQEASRPNTLVVVAFHGGGEGDGYLSVPHTMESYLGEKRGELRRLSRALIDAGAHLVIGHGPHVPRGFEIYKDRLIAYSLGNFATGRGLSVSGRKSLAPLLIVDITHKGKLVGGQVVSFRQEKPGRLKLDSDGAALKLMHGLSLADFDLPALAADGSIVSTEKAALALAAAAPAGARAKLLAKSKVTAEAAGEVEAAKAEEVEPEPKPVAAKDRVGQGKAKAAKPSYEWDMHADLRRH